jgi:hypothetical protein
MSPNTNIVFSGLGTESCGVITAGPYTVDVQALPPYNVDSNLNSAQQDTSNVRSAVSIAIKQNGSTLQTTGGTGSNPSANQRQTGTRFHLSCAAGDTIAVQLSSANPNDSAANALKTLISVFQGA